MYRKDLSHLEKGEIHLSHPSKWGGGAEEGEGGKLQSSELCVVRSESGRNQRYSAGSLLIMQRREAQWLGGS